MMHKVDDLESAAACDAMVASIRRGLLVGVVMVAAVAIVIPVLGRPPRLAASTATAASRPATVGVPAVSLRPADFLATPGGREAAGRAADSPDGAGAVPVNVEFR